MGASCQAEGFPAQDVSMHLPVLLSLSMCSCQLSVITKIKHGARVVCGKPFKSYHLDDVTPTAQVSHVGGQDTSESTFGEHFEILLNSLDTALEISSKPRSLFAVAPSAGSHRCPLTK